MKKKLGKLKLNRETLHKMMLKEVPGGLTATCFKSCVALCTGPRCTLNGCL